MTVLVSNVFLSEIREWHAVSQSHVSEFSICRSFNYLRDFYMIARMVNLRENNLSMYINIFIHKEM
jgi:hypothetical protein